MSAIVKASGSSGEITIKNEKGRLTDKQISDMVRQAEKYKVEDAKIKKKILIKNGLDSSCKYIRNTLKDERVTMYLTVQEDKQLRILMDAGFALVNSL